jgi:hypothetical protein
MEDGVCAPVDHGLTDREQTFRYEISSNTPAEEASFLESVGMPTEHHYRTGRRLCRTFEECLGMVPSDAQAGDRIIVRPGGRVPYVIRKEQDGIKLIGEWYVE